MSVLLDLVEAAGATFHATSQADEVIICCPFCSERGFSEDDKFHLGLNTANGKAHCFKCDWKSSGALYTLKSLRKAYGVDFRIRRRELEDVPEAPKKKRLKPIDWPDEFESLAGSLDSVGRRVRRYLGCRGVTIFQIVRHRIAFSAMGDCAYRAVFPVLGADQQVYGWVARGISDGQVPKYLNMSGMKMLWGTHIQAERAVVVEGILDALSVERALLQRSGIAALARLGSTITPAQIEQLRGYQSITILPDFDVAGVKGAIKFGEALREAGIRHIRIVIPELCDGRDPGSMDAQTVLGYVDAAVKWTRGTKFRLRLAASRGDQ